MCKHSIYEIKQFKNKSIQTKTIQPRSFENDPDTLLHDWAESPCYICLRDDHHDKLLICDGCDSIFCHTYCLYPPLETVPQDEWFCYRC